MYDLENLMDIVPPINFDEMDERSARYIRMLDHAIEMAVCAVTLTPTFVVGGDIKSGRLMGVLTEYQSLEVSIYAVYPQRKHLSPKVRAFIDYLSEQIDDPPYWEPSAVSPAHA